MSKQKVKKINMKQSLDWSVTRGHFSFKDGYTALLELIDNSIMSGAKEIRLLLDRKHDRIRLTDTYGLGMNKKELEENFLHWGREEPVGVGRYFGVGGKGAIGFIGKNAEVWSTPKSMEVTYVLRLPDYKEQTIKGNISVEVEEMKPAQFLNPTVTIWMRKLNVKFSLPRLRTKISTTYSSWLKENTFKLSVDDKRWETIVPAKLLMKNTRVVNVESKYGKVIGEIGLKVSSLTRGGIRCYSGKVGRLISSDEKFGFDKERDIDADQLVGHIDNDFVSFTVHKDNFEKNTPEWEEFNRVMRHEIKPVAELVKRTPRDLKGVDDAMRDVENLLNKALNEMDDDFFDQGRKPPEASQGTKVRVSGSQSAGRTHEQTINRSEIDVNDPVGITPRRGHFLIRKEVVSDLTHKSRSERTSGGVFTVYLNTEFPPMRVVFRKGQTPGATCYMITAALEELYECNELDVDKYRDKVNAVVSSVVLNLKGGS